MKYDVTTARLQLAFPSLHHRRLVAVATVLFRTHASDCPSHLRSCHAFPTICERPGHSAPVLPCPHDALSIPVANTNILDRDSIYTAVRALNKLPEDIVGVTADSGTQAFKRCVHLLLFTHTIVIYFYLNSLRF